MKRRLHLKRKSFYIPISYIRIHFPPPPTDYPSVINILQRTIARPIGLNEYTDFILLNISIHIACT